MYQSLVQNPYCTGVVKLPKQQHDLLKVYTLLNQLRNEPKNLMKLHKELKKHKGFRAFHSMYKHLRVCANLKFVEITKVNKKWGLPTKTYRLTEKGEEFLEIFDLKETSNLDEIIDLEEVST